MSIDNYYTDTVHVLRPSGSNAGGVYIETFTTQSTVVGVVEVLDGSERYMNNKKEKLVTHRLFCPVIDVDVKDKILIDSTNYEIDFIGSYRNHHLEIILLETE